MAGKKPSQAEAARFLMDHAPEPAYLALLRSGELKRRVDQAISELEQCRACPRECGVDRLHALPSGEHSTGRSAGRVAKAWRGRVPDHVPKGTACFTGRHARVSSAFPHLGEEDCLRGSRGSGTIFFSFCNLRCVFCQNWDISQDGEGVESGAEDLAGLMLELQSRGCHNINFVTPEHVVPQVLEGVLLAAGAGLRIPLVYNTSAYDSMQSLALLDGVVDIYMPDFKYWSPDLARRHLKAADYPEAARRAIREMHRQVGPLCCDRHGVAVRGLLVRHLVMPGCADDSREIFRYLTREVSPDTFINIMAQYHPAGSVKAGKFPELSRCPTADEFRTVVGYARAEGLWRFDHRCVAPR
jgi:putative pyruvate formate lyase activating enzyme